MSKPKVYIGLDVAQTVGIAVYDGDSAKVTDARSYPYIQLILIVRLAQKYILGGYLITFVMEQPVHFQNAKTTRELLGRYGYLRWSLIHNGYDVQEANLNSVRAFLKCKTKRAVFDLMLPCYSGLSFTDDKSDALACCLYQAHKEGKLELPIVPLISDWRE